MNDPERTLELRTENGPLTIARAMAVRKAYHALKELAEDERGIVLCWFCRWCHRYVGPGDTCHCEHDE